MGYGVGRITQYSRDGGIDGEIYEDKLGLDRIQIQAKRYQREATIGRPEIQSFMGAITGKSSKGVFITTARFSKDAHEYAASLANTRIVLVGGEKLAEYIYEYGLGMQVEQTISIKRLDGDFWDELEDSPPTNTNRRL